MNLAVIGSGGREHAICYKLKQSPKIKRLICIPGNAGIEEIAENIRVDITKFHLIYKILKKYKIDIVIHLAAKNISYESKNNPIDFYESNVADSIIMLKKMIKFNVKKIIYLSSSSVYGIPKNLL